MGSQRILSIESASKSYMQGKQSVVILKNIQLNQDAGTMIAITGPSGCGKTTLLQCAAGLDQFCSGVCTLFGHDMQTMTPSALTDLRAKHIGFVYQRPHLLPDFTVLENVMMPLRINGYQQKPAQKLALESLDAVGLSHVAAYMPNALSGGMQQRVAIARAVVHKPRMIFADEPTGNLDGTSKAQCMHFLVSLQRAIGAALCIVTHDDWVASHADQIIEMEAINPPSMGE